MTGKLCVSTKKRSELVDITAMVRDEIGRNKVKDGIIYLYVPHTTAALTVNENADPSVKADIIRTMSGMVPENGGYTHAEGNSDAHIKSSLFGFEMFFFIEDGGPVLGTWQGIYFCEFDGPRQREIKYMIRT